MGKIHYPNRDWLKATIGEKLTEALDALQQGQNAVFAKSSMSPSGASAVPPNISSLTLTAGGGVFQAVIQDNNPVTLGITYFIEYSDTPSFSQPHVVNLGPARTWRSGLGALTLYFRAYSQYQGGDPSKPVYFGSGNVPSPVNSGGTTVPALPASTGSGTASGSGTQGGSGYGLVQKRLA